MNNYDYAVNIYCKVFDVTAENGDAHVRGILDTIETLGKREQKALECFFRDLKSYRQTAEILGISTDAARILISKAIFKLRHSSGAWNMSVKAIIEHRARELEKANATITALYEQLEAVLQGGAVAPKVQAVLESRKTSVYALGVSSRTCSLLSKAGIRTVEALLALNTLDNLMKLRGFGQKSRDELIKKMRKNGYSEWADKMKRQISEGMND